MGFNNIIGHEKIIGRLKKALEKNEVASAYLFWGSDSIGKGITAIAFAKAINCLTNNTDACEQCTSCSKIEKSIHPDVRIIAPEGEIKGNYPDTPGTERKSNVIKIEQIRPLQNEMAYPPFEGKKRVFIIDNADKMNLAAANSLLKTLEEPARNSVIILVTSRPNSLLPTIISRCQGIRFVPPPLDAVKGLLIKRGISDDDARLIASMTQGRIGSALNAEPDAIKEKRDEYLSIFFAALHSSTGEVFSLIEKYGKNNEAAIEILDWLYIWLRDVIIFKETREDKYLINSDKAGKMKEWLDIETARFLDIMKSITEIQRALTRNINKQLALEKVLIELKEVEYK